MPSFGELGVLAVLGGLVGFWGLWAGRGQAPVLSCILEGAGLPGLEGKVVLVTGANTGRKRNLSHRSETKKQGLATTQPWPWQAGVGGW